MNAAVFGLPYGTTVDGVERHFGVNHLGHFRLFQLLEDIIRECMTRILVVSSDSHWSVDSLTQTCVIGFVQLSMYELCATPCNLGEGHVDAFECALPPCHLQASQCGQRVPWPVNTCQTTSQHVQPHLGLRCLQAVQHPLRTGSQPPICQCWNHLQCHSPGEPAAYTPQQELQSMV